jgi:hypothetical protein
MYVLANITLKPGPQNLSEFNDLITRIAPLQEAACGWRLVHRLVAQTGRLWEVCHLWEVQDANHVAEGRVAIRNADPALAELAGMAGQYVLSEDLRYLESVVV